MFEKYLQMPRKYVFIPDKLFLFIILCIWYVVFWLKQKLNCDLSSSINDTNGIGYKMYYLSSFLDIAN